MTGERFDALWKQRAVLCDLITGHMLRVRAAQMLESALESEALGFPLAIVQQDLDAAAHMEWIAEKSERGQILWGGRYDRYGRNPEGDLTDRPDLPVLEERE